MDSADLGKLGSTISESGDWDIVVSRDEVAWWEASVHIGERSGHRLITLPVTCWKSKSKEGWMCSPRQFECVTKSEGSSHSTFSL